MEIGPLLLRVVVGLLFVGYGTQKLFGWFGGHGTEGTARFYDENGGCEYDLVLATAAATLALAGPGSLALGQTGGPVWGLAAIALAVLTALPVLALRSARSATVEASPVAEATTSDERQAA